MNEDEDDLFPIFVPPIPPPRCKVTAHPEWRGNEREGYWVCVDDSEWQAVQPLIEDYEDQ